MEINEQIAERDLVATRKTLRGTHVGQLWDLAATGNRVEFEFVDIFRVVDGKLIEHWTSMDLGALARSDARWVVTDEGLPIAVLPPRSPPLNIPYVCLRPAAPAGAGSALSPSPARLRRLVTTGRPVDEPC